MAQQWKAVEGAAKNDSGEYQALVGGKWQPVAGAAKNDAGEYMALMDDAPQPGIIGRATAAVKSGLSAVNSAFSPPTSVMDGYVDDRQSKSATNPSLGQSGLSQAGYDHAVSMARTGSVPEQDGGVVSRAVNVASGDNRAMEGRQAVDDAAAQIKVEQQAQAAQDKAFRTDHPIMSGFASGAAQLAESVADAPAFANDTIKEVAINPFMRLFGQEPMKPTERFSIAKDLENTSNALRPDIANKKLSELKGAGDYTDWIAAQAAIQAPQIVGSTGAAFIPKLRAAYLGMMGVTSGALQYQQDLEKNVTQRRAWLDGVTNGAFEALGEALPFAAFDKIGALVMRMPASQRAPFIAEAVKKTLAATGAVLGQHAAEGGSEAFTQVGQNVSQRYIAGDKTQGVMDQVPEAAAIGAIMATPMALSHGYHAARQPQSPGAALGNSLQSEVDGNRFDQRAITEDALRALSPTGKLPMPLTAKAAEASARQKSIVTGQPHQVIEHPAEAGKFTAVPSAVAHEVEQKSAEAAQPANADIAPNANPSTDDILSGGLGAPEIHAEDAAMLQQAEEFGQAAAPVDHFANGVTPEALDSLFAESRAKAADRVAAPIAAPAPVSQYDTPAVSDNLADIIPANPVDAAAHDAATSPLNGLQEPTDAMKRAGNYRKGHITIHGLDVAIENPKGSGRAGTDPNGEAWNVTLPAHYGYIKRTTGADGGQVDAYIGSNPESDKVFVVDQINPATGAFDEHKVMVGFNGMDDAVKAYHAGFMKNGGDYIGSITPMTVDAFKTWLKEGDTKQPAAPQAFAKGNHEASSAKPLPADSQPDHGAGRAAGNVVQPSPRVVGSDAASVGRAAAVDGGMASREAQRHGDAEGADARHAAGSDTAVAPDVTAAIRSRVEQLVKRRAVAQQIKRGDYFGAALQEAKNAMSGKKVSAEKMRKHAIAFASDAKLADAFNGIADVLEVSRQAKQPAQKKPQKASTDLLQRIKQLGGIDGTLALDITGEKRAPGGWKFAFKKGGTGLDDLATMLASDGFMIDTSDVDGGVQQLRDMIRSHIGGERNFKAQTQEAHAEAMARDQDLNSLAQRADELGINWKNLNAQQLSDAVYEAEDALEMARLDNELELTDAGADAFDAIVSDETITEEEQDIPFGNELQRAELDAIDAHFNYGANNEEGNTGQAGSTAAARADQGTEGGEAGVRESQAGQGEVLQSYTAAEVAARERAQAAQESAQRTEAAKDKEAQAKKEKDDTAARAKAHADNPENFVFGESSKDAVKPMGSLFDQPAKPTNTQFANNKIFTQIDAVPVEQRAAFNAEIAERKQAIEELGYGNALKEMDNEAKFSKSSDINEQVHRLQDKYDITREDARQMYESGDRIDAKGNKYTAGALYSEGQKPVTGMSKARVHQATLKLRAKWLGFRKINIVQSVKEIPNELYLRALRAAKPINQDSEGIYDPMTRTVYLIADNIATPERSVWVAAHEVVGHGGIRMLDKSVAEHVGRLSKNGTIEKLAQAIAKDRGETFDKNEHTQEAIAELAAAHVNRDAGAIFDRYGVKATGIAKNGLRGMVQHMIDAIRRFMSVVMGKKVDEVSDSEVRSVINAARRAVEGIEQAGEQGASGYALASHSKGGRGELSGKAFARMTTEEFVAENDPAFIHAVSNSNSLEGVLNDIADTEYHGEHTRMDERDESGADHRYVFTTPDGATFHVYETDAGRVWIDVSRLETGTVGQAIYAAVANYAYNTRKVFGGDPAGLSKAAMIRRTSNMLSSALRFGTTRHLDAAKEQIDGDIENGIEPLNWRGTDIDKIEALIHTFVASIQTQYPVIKGYRYDFQTAQFSDAQGRPVTGAAISANLGRDARAGERTARRAVFLQALMDSTGEGVGQRSGILEQVLRWGESSSHPDNLNALFSTGNRTTDELRNRAATASAERSLRILSKAQSESANPLALSQSDAPLSSRAPSGTAQLGLNATAAQPANSSIPEETEFQTRQRQVQDKMNRFKVLQAWLNHKGVKLTDKANVHEVENLMHAKIANQTQDFRDQVEAPLLERAAKAGFTLEQIADYLEAQHIPEANARMRDIHQDATATANGISDAEANATLAQFQSMPKFAEFKTLADEFRAIGDETLDIRLREGLISREQYDAYKATFKHWVPLRGDGKKPGVGKGLSVNAKEKRRLGHGERENGEYIIENLLMDRERAIYQVEHNRVVKSIIQFALEAKEPGMITVGKPEKRQVLKDQSVFEVQHKGKMMRAFSSENDAKAFINQAIALSSQNKGGGMARSNFAIAKTSDPIVVMQASPMLAENEIQGYVAGHTIRIQLNDELLARAATNMGVDQLNMLLSAARTINNGLSKIYTAYSPDFIFRNATRDFIAGTINLTGDMGVKMAGKIYLNYGKAAKELFIARNDPRKSAWVQKYRAAGGNTGAAYLSDIERVGNDARAAMYERMKALDVYRTVYGKLIAEGRGQVYAHASAAMRSGISKFGAISVVGHFLTLIKHLNAVTENALRLATYMTLVQNGYTEQKAASAAKNSTVNFNRKGEISNVAGSLYLFFNPSVQGSSRMFGSLLTSEHKGQAQAMAGMLAFAAFALAELGRGGDDDDERKWKNIPDYVKDHNMILKFGDLQWTIPVPYEFAPFHVLGNSISDAVHGESGWKSALKVVKSIVDNTTPLGDPFTGDGKDGANLYQMSPTLVKMVLAPHENENSFGAPIQPEKASYSKNKPDSQNMFRNTKGTLYSGAAEWMNEVTGGSKYQPGGVDVSPETLKFWVSSLTGGTGRFVTDSIGAAYGLTQDVAPDLRSTPIARVFVREPSVADARSRFWEAANEAKQAADAFAMAKKGHDGSAMKEIRDADNDLIQLSRFADRMGKAAAKKRDLIDQIRMDDQMPLAQKREQMKEMEQKEQEYYDRFLKAFDQKQKARKDKAA